MKTNLLLCVALIGFVPARGEIFRPAAASGALIGGVTGAIIGGTTSGSHGAWQGAAIGATTGLFLGAAVDSAHYGGGYVYGGPAYAYHYPAHYYPAYHSAYHYPVYHSAYHYPVYHYPVYHSHYPYYPPAYGYYGYGYYGPGSVILGASLGYVFGSIAASHAHDYGYRDAAAEQAPVYQQPAPAPATPPQNVTIINNYNAPATPMSAANGLFGR